MKTKVCPLLTISSSKAMKAYWNCIQDRCAFWDYLNKCCALEAIARHLKPPERIIPSHYDE